MTRPPSRSTLFPYTTLFRSACGARPAPCARRPAAPPGSVSGARPARPGAASSAQRSEEHTSELQSRFDLVCRLLLEKKKKHHETLAHPAHKNYTDTH